LTAGLRKSDNPPMLTPLKNEVLHVADLAHEARRFRTILWSFERNIDLLFSDTGLKAKLDTVALARAFTGWREAFEQSKYLADANRHDFVIFAAGLMLKELVAAAPLKAIDARPAGLPPLPADTDHRLGRWPEGYAYTSFCLSVAAAILRELGEDEPDAVGQTEDPKFWDSFRENALESPAAAVAFFDLVCGQAPNWDAPDVPALRKALMARRDLLPAATAG
jgi:hypothetical protein